MAKFKNKKDIEFYESVINHKEKVKKLISNMSTLLWKRGDSHDDSKLEEPEFSGYAENFISEEKRDPESEEYQECREKLEETITIHHRKNRHHPEFFGNGIKGMTLIDICELLCDWVATTRIQDKGNLRITIERNREKYKFSKELEQILLNTLELLDTMKDIKGE